MVVAQIRRRSREDSARSGENLAISGEDSTKIWRVKLTPTSTDPTVVHRIPIRLDPRLPAVGGGLFNVPPDVSGSVPGWVQTRPGPTRGHPYLKYCTRSQSCPTLNLLACLCLVGPCTDQAKSAFGNFVMSGPTIINSPLQIAFIVKNKHFD